MTKESNKKKKLLRNDVILIGAILLIAIAGGLFLLLFRGFGDYVQVTIDGELYGTYSLSHDLTENIYTSEDKSSYNRLVISGGKAYVESASCPDKICAEHRPVHRKGESIVCLPNRVVITVIAAETEGSPDIVA